MGEFLFFANDKKEVGKTYESRALSATAVKNENGRYQVLEEFDIYMGANQTTKIDYCECKWNNDLSSNHYTSEEVLAIGKLKRISSEEFLNIRNEILQMADKVIGNYNETANNANFFFEQDDNYMDMVRKKLVSSQGEENKKNGIKTTMHDFYYSESGEECKFRISYVNVDTFEESSNFYTENPISIDKETYFQNVQNMYSKCKGIKFPDYSQTKKP
jgi:hypothetical protein